MATITSTGSPDVGAVQVKGYAVRADISASGAVDLPVVEVAPVVLVIRVAGIGDIVLAPVTVSGAATNGKIGRGAISTRPVSVAGVGAPARKVAPTLSTGAVAVSVQAKRTVPAEGGALLAAALAGCDAIVYRLIGAVGDLSVAAAAISGNGARSASPFHTVSGAVAMLPIRIEADGDLHPISTPDAGAAVAPVRASGAVKRTIKAAAAFAVGTVACAMPRTQHTAAGAITVSRVWLQGSDALTLAWGDLVLGALEASGAGARATQAPGSGLLPVARVSGAVSVLRLHHAMGAVSLPAVRGGAIPVRGVNATGNATIGALGASLAMLRTIYVTGDPSIGVVRVVGRLINESLLSGQIYRVVEITRHEGDPVAHAQLEAVRAPSERPSR